MLYILEGVDRTDMVDAGPDIDDLMRKMTLENKADAQVERYPAVTQARNVPINRDMLIASATHPGQLARLWIR